MASRVRYTSFRRSSTAPAGVASIHYNNQKGLVAMASHLRRTCCGVLPAYTVRAGVTVRLVDNARRPLRGLQIAGRTIVMGQAGHRYGILLRNRTGYRYEIVVSVDGLDVIDGRRAATSKRGYIVPPWGEVHIRGFRTSGAAVAAFRFGSVANSYAARTGSARNVGVVGVAVFTEYRPVWTRDEVNRRLRARPFDDRYTPPPPVRY